MEKSFILLFLLTMLYSCQHSETSYEGWNEYLGGKDRNHYTTLDQINAENLDELKVAWIYNAPDTGQMQMNPIIANGMVYGVSAALKAFALDAETGEEKWIFGEYDKVWHSTSRGVSYWEDGDDKRILYTMGKDLIALNALSGEIIESFGNNGRVDLHTGLPEVAQDKFIISNTPGAIYKDLIVMPVRLSESEDAAPGDIRAFNVKTGDLEWSFHVIPYPGEKGYDTWEDPLAYKNESMIGAGNNWAGMAVDETSGIIYIPTGSFAPDFYGGHRKGTNLFSDCLLALEAETGKLLWYYQFVHHDIWDRDLPAPPNLITVTRNGKEIKAVAQVTKQGYVFIFDRKTGEPLFDIEEIPVPGSPIAEEEAWPTQPIPVNPLPYSRRSDGLTEQDISPYAPNKEELLSEYRNAHKDFFFPPDTTDVLLLPGYDGGAEWGGAGASPEEGILYINANEMAWMLSLTPNLSEGVVMNLGEMIYHQKCSVCHQKDRKGISASGYPSLVDIGEKLTEGEILTIIVEGKGVMTGVSGITDEEKSALLDYLLDRDDQEKKEIGGALKNNLPYRHSGYTKWLDSNGLPAISPPWGTLSAIDMNTGNILWNQPFGTVDSLMEAGFPVTGTENYGGPIITENGLLIIAATKDAKLRIFNRHSGELLWEDRLTAAAFATPSTYMINGKQYIVVACGGEKLGTKPGNKVIAYAIQD